MEKYENVNAEKTDATEEREVLLLLFQKQELNWKVTKSAGLYFQEGEEELTVGRESINIIKDSLARSPATQSGMNWRPDTNSTGVFP